MKRLFVLLAIISVVSCEHFATSNEIKAVENAKSEAIRSIEDDKSAAIESIKAEVSSAKSTISQTISKAVEGANNDLSSVLNSAKSEIQSSVQISVKEEMDKEREKLSSEIEGTKRLVRLLLLLVVIALLLAIGAIVYAVVLSKEIKHVSGKNLKEDVVTIVTESDRIRRYYLCLNANKQVSKEEVKAIVLKVLEQKQSQISSSQRPNEAVGPKKSSSENPQLVNAVEPPIEPPIAPKAVQVVEPVNIKTELFARDSDSSDILSGVHSSFLQGKSIYKLILDNKDDSYATLTLCLEQDVQRRILKSGDDFLTPVCKIERKSPEPQVVAVSSVGKAEKVDTDTWKVVTPISVVLS